MRCKEFLTTKISWSKNVKDQTNSPVQIMLPDLDPRTCVCMSLALFPEADLQFGDRATSQWLFARGKTTRSDNMKEQDKECEQGKEQHARVVKKATLDPAFERVEHVNNRLGSHSTPKTAATRC